MPCYDRIDISEWIHINKVRASRECDICHCWYFLNNGFKFQTYVCNRCHDLVMMSTSLIIIYNYCIINEISKSEATKLLQNIDWLKKVEHYKKINIKNNFEVINLLEILI